MNMGNVQSRIHGLVKALGSSDDAMIKGALLSLDAKDLKVLDEQINGVKKIMEGETVPS